MHFAAGARSSKKIIPRWLGAAATTLLMLLAAECATRPPAAGGAPGLAAWNNTALVQTRSGWIRGRRDADCTWSWKGIPYAAPPVGDLRWRAPRDPQPWQGVREAARFGPEPVQYVSSGRGIKGSEDCLYLDVRRPRDGEAGLPVYVYIHGGGNSAGSSHADPECSGSRLAARSRVVFVAVEYRVGPLGWFAHPALREGVSPEDDSGNFGTLDLVKALQWIQGNIEAFGGDPHTVLIAGASGGGANVLSLMASPLADGLFHRAFVQSALTYTTSFGDAEAQAEEVVRLLLRHEQAGRSAGEASRVAAAMAPVDLRAYLRSKSANEILSCYPPGILGMIDAHPLLRDGFVLPGEGLPALEGRVPCGSVPVIVGGTHDELSIFLAVDGTWDWESRQFSAAARYGSAVWNAVGVDAVASCLARRPASAPVFAYRFEWGAEGSDGQSVLPGRWGRRLGAFHCLDTPFFFGTDTFRGLLGWVLFNRQNEPGRDALSGLMMRYVARFIRTGDPNCDGLPRWDPWCCVPGGPKALIFDAGRAELRVRMSCRDCTTADAVLALRQGFPVAIVEEVLANESRLPPSDFDE